MFSKILIANRGEIALRIIRACKELSVSTVAVYSQADADSLHVRMADEAVCIGDATPAGSYLNIPAIISAAEITDVEAIHPGYGFLAENAHFAEICQSCEIQFIGPSPESIHLMGDKIAAKNLMQKVGVPVIPGSEGGINSKEEALKFAKAIKYPVIIKAAAGGGGRGMRVCHNDVRLISAMSTAQAEAEKAFGNPEVYMEKFFETPRHVEVQIIADKFGNVVHLGERDCTVQRRHQKLIEESPSPFLTSEIRKEMCEMAVKAAKACKYTNAGTIEFLVDDKRNFYFMEMNTRIQVEHPVTEMVTRTDLIKEQLRIASGEKLSFSQNDIKIKGAAIECRINAEDPENDFMPSPGKIESLIWPGSHGIRVDSHVYPGYTIPPFYDSMIAKIIAYADTRDEAIAKMLRALDETDIGPIKTTTAFHKEILTHNDFIKSNITTDFINKMLDSKKNDS